MVELTQISQHYIRYRDIVLQRGKEYTEKENQRNRYKNLSQEEKNKLVEKREQWFNGQTEEKQEEMKRKAREYAKNRYHNHIVVVDA